MTADDDRPQTLRKITIICDPQDDSLAFLAHDIADATLAYAHLSGTRAPTFHIVGPDEDAPGTYGDGIVVAKTLSPDANVIDLNRMVLGTIGPNTPVYLLVHDTGDDRAKAVALIHHACKSCTDAGLAWKGALHLRMGAPFTLLTHSPRMGLLRRPFSESIDKLIGALRMGCSIRRAQELGGADVSDIGDLGTIVAQPALPAPLWRAAMHLFAHRINGMHTPLAS